jgi:hypothetical protein
MKAKQYGNWIVDLEKMTCFNTENELVIAFEKKGPTFQGKIKIIPLDLAEKWMKDPNCEKYIRKALVEADEIFFKEYFARKTDRKSIETRITA